MRIFLFFILLTVLNSCKKNIEQEFYVNYQVSLNTGNSVNIYCFNDYYYNSGYQLKKINYKSDLNFFSSTRLSKQNDYYYLRVEPDLLLKDTVNITALVTINDSVVNFFQSKTFKEPIVLMGFVK